MAQFMSTSPKQRLNTPQYEPRTTPLPTRVTRACERCRRNKSRCDLFRPCSLCLRSNTQCLSADDNEQSNISAPKGQISRPAKRSKVTEPTASTAATGKGFMISDTSSQSSVTKHASLQSNEHHEIDGFSYSKSDNQHGILETVEDGEAGSAMGIARKIYRLGSQAIDERSVDAIPGADVGNRTTSDSHGPTRRQPITSFMKHALPERAVMNMLLEEYFFAVHWFSLVVYEPRLRSKLKSVDDGFAESSDKSFLMLLSTMLGMTAWYTSQKPQSETGHSNEFWKDLSAKLIENVESQLVEILDQTRLTAVQTCILLGSYYVYHGRPNLSLSLLGATIKTAQVMGLYLEPKGVPFAEAEEKRRVWWTIYTWDRFATVTYGRPLGIDEKDCSVAMPADILEDPHFVTGDGDGHETQICYSSYQRELNSLYMIASPAIEALYRSPHERDSHEILKYSMLVQNVTSKLEGWRERLPAHLVLDLDHDCPLEITPTSRVHRLQSLALQLTFDNIVIILHRPFLSRRIDLLRGQGTSPTHVRNQQETSSVMSFPTIGEESSEALFSNLQTSTPGQWWTAAMRTSRVTELPHMAQLAADSHLVAFLAINLFNSAIVIAVMALSNPLSDEAQGAKRTITRILRLQELLDIRSTLSRQSSAVLRNVVHLLLRREAEAILAPVPAQLVTGEAPPTTTRSTPLPRSDLLSVEATLNLPLDISFDTEMLVADEFGQATAERASRLNESLASVQRAFNTNHNSPWRRMSYPEVQAPINNYSNGSRTQELSQWTDDYGGSTIDPNFDPLYWIWENTLGLQ